MFKAKCIKSIEGITLGFTYTVFTTSLKGRFVIVNDDGEITAYKKKYFDYAR